MKTKIFTALILLLPINLMAAALLPGDAAKGEKLHNDNSCLSCHAKMTGGKPDMLYTRNDRRVSNIGGLIGQVGGCNKMQKVGLDEEGVDDVVKYLNESFYKFSD
jgi:mono/diheme cytochrome c family protein